MSLEPTSFDALLPPAMLEKAETLGEKKAALPLAKMFLLGIMAGVFIAFGAVFSVTVMSGEREIIGYGLTRLIGGFVFTSGLIMVVVGGAELFTGNMLMVTALASRRISFGALLRNWVVVYLGNLAGSLLIAALVVYAGWGSSGGGTVGLSLLQIGEAKTSLAFLPALALGFLCNFLVCMAIWMTYSARSLTDKVMVIIPPIALFVVAGFEHSVANMFFISAAILQRAWGSAVFYETIGHTAADFPHLTLQGFFISNLLPVTLGNMLAGIFMVGVMYWLIYHPHTR